jgi:hypothetical protein
MTNHFTTTTTTAISKEALEAALVLFTCAEETHHVNVNRTDIIEKMAKLDRHLLMTCIVDLKRITESFKPVAPEVTYQDITDRGNALNLESNKEK